MKKIVLMKYGVHAKEKVDSIIIRKQKEIATCGYSLWGYGGSLLHPLNQVQPFCKDSDVYLLLSKTESKHLGDCVKSKYYSIDKVNFQIIPNGINVYSSKYALVLESLKKCDFNINLGDYEVALGKSKGKKLNNYFAYRVDKACAIYKKGKEERIVHIDYIAKLRNPYSVFVQEKLVIDTM